MRFALAHKLSTYLMVGFALVAMLAGGALAPPFALGSLALFLASWFWEPPTINLERWSIAWTVLSVVALAYSALTAVATGDFLGTGGQFLVWLVIVKVFNRRAARDYQQLYLLAFLMLVAGSVLNPDLTFGLCFLGFVISTTWALITFHLRREMEDNLLVKHAADRASERVEVRRILESRRIVNGRFFAGTGALSFGIFLASAAAFLALPRIGIGFFLKTRPGMTLTGFSDGVKLGGHGVLKSDPTVVMRVEVAPEVGGRAAPYIHWRGVAFDQYYHGEWLHSRGALASQGLTVEAQRGFDRHVMRWADKPVAHVGFDEAAEAALDKTYTRQEVWLEPLDSNVLFGAFTPMAYQFPHTLRGRSEQRPKDDEFRLEHGSTVHYVVWSDLQAATLDAATIARLRAAPAAGYPEGFETYLGPGVNPNWDAAITARTIAKAQEITRGLTNNYDKAVAIQAWLQRENTYTLELADPGSREPIDFFLFERKRGHCEYFASAFAILARAAQIPTRQVNGFLGGEWNEYKGYVAVRAGDAHSWDEVYFPGAGWVTFDPTPSASIDELGRGGDGWTAKLARMMDTLKFQWSKWVIEYDLGSQLSLFKGIGNGISGAVGWVKDEVVALWRRARTTIAVLWDRVEKQLARGGLPRAPAETPAEFAARAGADVAELVELYYAAEWGGRRDAEAEPRARALADAIRARLAGKRAA